VHFAELVFIEASERFGSMIYDPSGPKLLPTLHAEYCKKKSNNNNKIIADGQTDG